MATVKIYLYMFLLVIIVGVLDSLHRYHEIYLALHDLRFHRDDQSGRRDYSTIQYG
jgi:fumarate reductase subunit D